MAQLPNPCLCNSALCSLHFATLWITIARTLEGNKWSHAQLVRHSFYNWQAHCGPTSLVSLLVDLFFALSLFSFNFYLLVKYSSSLQNFPWSLIIVYSVFVNFSRSPSYFCHFCCCEFPQSAHFVFLVFANSSNTTTHLIDLNFANFLLSYWHVCCCEFPQMPHFVFLVFAISSTTTPHLIDFNCANFLRPNVIHFLCLTPCSRY